METTPEIEEPVATELPAETAETTTQAVTASPADGVPNRDAAVEAVWSRIRRYTVWNQCWQDDLLERLYTAERRASSVATGVETTKPPTGLVPTDGTGFLAPILKPYLSLEELVERTRWTRDAIRTMMKPTKGILKLGVHFFHRGRSIVFKWTAIVELIEGAEVDVPAIPLLRGGFLGSANSTTRTTNGLLD